MVNECSVKPLSSLDCLHSSVSLLKNILPSSGSSVSESRSPSSTSALNPADQQNSPLTSSFLAPSQKCLRLFDFFANFANFLRIVFIFILNIYKIFSSVFIFRTVNKKLPTGEVVKIRSRRTDVNECSDGTNLSKKTGNFVFKQAVVPALRSALSTVDAAVLQRSNIAATKQRAGDAAFIKLIKAQASCFQLLDVSEFKVSKTNDL